MSPQKWLRTAPLNAMLEAGCLQALAQGRVVTRLGLALDGREMSCTIALQSDEVREEGWNIAGGYTRCKLKGQNFQTLSKTESHIFLIVTCRIGLIKLSSPAEPGEDPRVYRGGGVFHVSRFSRKDRMLLGVSSPKANLTLQLLLFRPIQLS